MSIMSTTNAILLGKTLGLVVLMTKLTLVVASPTVQMSSTGDGEHVVGGADNLHDRSLSLANLAALEEIHTAEMIQALVDNILMTQLAVVSVSASVHTSLVVHKNRCILHLTLRTFPYVTDIEADDHASLHLLEGGGSGNHSSLQSGTQLFVTPRNRDVRIRWCCFPIHTSWS